MTEEEVLKGLREQVEYWERRQKHDGRDLKTMDVYFMNVCAEAAVIIMGKGEKDE